MQSLFDITGTSTSRRTHDGFPSSLIVPACANERKWEEARKDVLDVLDWVAVTSGWSKLVWLSVCERVCVKNKEEEEYD